MAFSKKGSRPTHYIAVTAPKGKGKGFEKGPYIGLWEGDGGNSPLFRGSVQGKYLDELFDFIKEYGDENVSFAIFESRDSGSNSRSNRGRNDERDDSDNRQSSRGRGSRREEEEEEKPRSSRRGRDNDRGNDEPKGRSAGKGKKDWFED